MPDNDYLFDNLTPEMIKSIFETIPGEITVINANDEVVGWNKHNTRIFRRPVVAMGMNFRECHPQKSLHLVEKIVNEMKSGKRDKARFWIDMKINEDEPKHKILIEFYALRSPSGKYLGCMEFDIDISEIKKLEGEKRLLDD
ncbi:MAG: PAS domain-containing protein [Elusimicrobiota bacterium]